MDGDGWALAQMNEAAAENEQIVIPAIAGMLSDERLARRAAAGDERAFAAIFRRFHQRLYRFCLAIVGNSEDAQEALQNTMVKALRSLPGEEREIKLKPWLYRIAHNESIELLRRRRETGQLDPQQAAPGAGPAQEAETRARLRHLLADLRELPERQRATILMRELAGLQVGDIAVALGTSSAVARQTLYEARLSLRQMGEGREMDCRLVTKALSDGDGRVIRRRDIRAHLRACADCRRFRDQIKARERDLGALAPIPAAAGAGILHGLLGGGPGGGGASLAGAVGGGVAKSVGASALLKGTAAVAVVAAIGVGAAQRGGLIDVGLPDGGGSAAPMAAPPGAGTEAVSGSAAQSGRNRASGRVSGEATAVGDGQTGASRRGVGVAERAGGKGPVAPGHAPVPTSPATAPGSGFEATHPSGKGHERQHPAAAAKGLENAASHASGGQVARGAKGHPAHPPHPQKPVHPVAPGKGAALSPHPPTGKAEANPKAAVPASDGEEGVPAHGSGNGP